MRSKPTIQLCCRGYAGGFSGRGRGLRLVCCIVISHWLTVRYRCASSSVLLPAVPSPSDMPQRPADRIVNHGNQVQLLSPAFQPVVLLGVPLHQLPALRPPQSPRVYPLYALSSVSTTRPPSSIPAASPGSLRCGVARPNILLPAWGQHPHIPPSLSSPPFPEPPPGSSGWSAVPSAVHYRPVPFLPHS